MKILVCISNVPDTTSKINFVDSNTKFDTQGVQFIINPNDEFGLTRAVWFQQKQQAEVTVLTVGDASCEPTLRKCLAIGADKAIRVDTDPTDGYYVAKQIAAVCEKESYDLIIAGRESIDHNGAMVPGLVAGGKGEGPEGARIWGKNPKKASGPKAADQERSRRAQSFTPSLSELVPILR